MYLWIVLQIWSPRLPHRDMSDDISKQRERERWKANKRAQRERAKPQRADLSVEFIAAVMAERDKRAALCHDLWSFDRRYLFGRNVYSGHGAFTADVWAARTILENEWGADYPTPTRIANMLWEHGVTHYYVKASIRPMVHRALETIAIMETTMDPDGDGPFWRPFVYRL